MPEAGEFVWSTFWRLDGLRPYADASPAPITPAAIREWAEMDGVPILREECRIILEMDAALRAAWADEAAAAAERREKARKSYSQR